MKALAIMGALLLGLSHSVQAETTTRYSGKISSHTDISLQQQLTVSDTVTQTQSTKPRDDAATYSLGKTASRFAAHGVTVEFELFSSRVELLGDQDDDGYFHRLLVSFDADTSSEVETVYAKVYLSHEGGDWYQVARSDLFEIHSNSPDDEYEILTELVDGYVPGYYDVLIELHSLFHPGIVASRIHSLDALGYAITLEDQHYDQRFVDEYYYETEVYGHAGSISIPGLILLALLVFIKLRYFSKRSNTK